MSFDTLAPLYRPAEAMLAGGVLQRCRTSFLAETSSCRHALIVGEGPGRFLIALLKSNSGVKVTCIERSAAMIQQAKKHVQREGLDLSRVRFENANALSMEFPPRVFDLIVTHFFLDCFRFEELSQVVSKLAASATEQAKWLVGDFCIPDSGWRRTRARAIHAAMYTFFRASTEMTAKQLTPPDETLRRAGFELVARRKFNFGLIHSDLWEKRLWRTVNPNTPSVICSG